MPGPLLLTGAAGKLGGWLRPHLARRPQGLRSTDVRPFGPALTGETIVQADLADAAAIDAAVAGCGAIVHFGAVSVEDGFERILQSNIVGTQNLFDAARRHGVKRIVYASSIHVVGYYPTTERIDADAPPRPDSYYAVSKVFGEALARLYVEKEAFEVACLRIGVALPEPTAPRNLWTWLSTADLLRLVDTYIDAERLGFTIVYGISGNDRRWWTNERADPPFVPGDNAERYAARLLPHGDTRDPADPGVRYHGGPFIPLALGQRP